MLVYASTDMIAVRRTIVVSSSPTDVFADLPPGERQEAFFLLPEARREALVADVSRPQLAPFVDRLDPG